MFFVSNAVSFSSKSSTGLFFNIFFFLLFSDLVFFVEYVESICNSSQHCFYPLLSYVTGRILLQSCFPHACSAPPHAPLKVPVLGHPSPPSPPYLNFNFSSPLSLIYFLILLIRSYRNLHFLELHIS